MTRTMFETSIETMQECGWFRGHVPDVDELHRLFVIFQMTLFGSIEWYRDSVAQDPSWLARYESERDHFYAACDASWGKVTTRAPTKH